MTTRTHLLTIAESNLDGTPARGVYTVALLTPGAIPVVNLEGRELLNGILETGNLDGSGNASPTVVYTGDLRQANDGTTLVTCFLVVTVNGRVDLSPASYAYASSIALSSWRPTPSTVGTIRMLLGENAVNNAVAPGTVVQLDITQTATRPDGRDIFAGYVITYVADSGGNLTFDVVPTLSLVPNTTRYILRYFDSVGTIKYILAPQTPTGYQGAWSGAVTYNPNAGTKASPADVVLSGGIYYQSILSGINHVPPNATYWAVWQGEPVNWNTTAVTLPGQIPISTSSIGHDANVDVLPDDPVASPTTLSEDLDNLADRLAFAVRTVSAATAVTAADDYIRYDGTTANGAITLPNANARARPIFLKLVVNSSHAATITPVGGQLLDGAASLVLSTLNQAVMLRVNSAANGWDVFSFGGGGGGGGSWELTDGVHDLVAVTKTTVSNMTVGGTAGASTLRPNSMGASGPSHAPGIVPDPGGAAGTTRFLREDATYAIPTLPASSPNLTPPARLWRQALGAGAPVQGPVATIIANTRTNAFPGFTVDALGRLVACYRDGSAHISADGVVKLAIATLSGTGTLSSWAITTIATPAGGHDYRDTSITCLTNGRLIVSFFDEVSSLGVAVYTMFLDFPYTGSWSTPVSAAPFTGESVTSGPVLEHSSGVLVQPLYGTNTGDSSDRAAVRRSLDGGATWGSLIYVSAANTALTEMCLVEMPDHSIKAFMRKEGSVPQAIWSAFSVDTGLTWSAPASLGFNVWPGRPAARLVPRSSELVVLYRSASSEQCAYQWSADGGATWSGELILDAGTYDYGAMAPIDEVTLGVVYAVEISSSVANVYFTTLQVGNAGAGGLSIGGVSHSESIVVIPASGIPGTPDFLTLSTTGDLISLVGIY